MATTITYTYDWQGSPHQECTISTPIFEGKKMYYRAEVYMYCIGEK